MTETPSETLSLVADIGGTNTRVALARGKDLLTGSIRRFRNADFPGLEPVLTAYIAAEGAPACGAVCVAAAGPVANGVASMTNLDWKIDSATLTRATGARRTAILNDLQAQGHALGHISPENLRPVIEAPKAPADATKLVIGIGTGFNAAPVYETPGGRLVAASECGHVNMPIRTEADLRLAHFVETAHGFPGVEDVMSGRGLERLYTFVTSEAGQPKTKDAAAIMAAIGSENGHGPASQTARLFVRLLGGAAGNLALTHLPFGGIYLCGGVARAYSDLFAPLGFAEAFRDKGRFAGFMSQFSVRIIEDDYAALTGSAVYLSQPQNDQGDHG